jgi:hypothetical protein
MRLYSLDRIAANSAANRLDDATLEIADPTPGQLRGVLPSIATDVNSGSSQIAAATWIAQCTPGQTLLANGL